MPREKFHITITANETTRIISHGDGTREVAKDDDTRFIGSHRVRVRHNITLEERGIRQSSKGSGQTKVEVSEKKIGNVRLTRISAYASAIGGEGDASVNVARGRDGVVQEAADFAVAKGTESSGIGRLLGNVVGGFLSKFAVKETLDVHGDLEAGRTAKKIDRSWRQADRGMREGVRATVPGAVVTTPFYRGDEVTREVRGRQTDRDFGEQFGSGWNHEIVSENPNTGDRSVTVYADQGSRNHFETLDTWSGRAESVQGGSDVQFERRDYNIASYENGRLTDVKWGDSSYDPSGGMTYTVGGEEVSEADYTSMNG